MEKKSDAIFESYISYKFGGFFGVFPDHSRAENAWVNIYPRARTTIHPLTHPPIYQLQPPTYPKASSHKNEHTHKLTRTPIPRPKLKSTEKRLIVPSWTLRRRGKKRRKKRQKKGWLKMRQTKSNENEIVIIHIRYIKTLVNEWNVMFERLVTDDRGHRRRRGRATPRGRPTANIPTQLMPAPYAGGGPLFGGSMGGEYGMGRFGKLINV